MRNQTNIFIHIMLLSFGILCLEGSLNAQNILEVATWDENDLSPIQLSRYNKVSNEFNSSEITHINIGDISTVQNNIIDVGITNSYCTNTECKGIYVEYESNQDYSWYGEIKVDTTDSCACKFGYLLLMSKGGEKFGHLKLEDDYYTIFDIGGKNILVEFPDNEYGGRNCGGSISPEINDNESEIQIRSAGNCNIDALVLYTESADEKATGIENLIKSQVFLTNQAMRNSYVSSSEAKIKLAAIEQLDGYDETDLTFSEALYQLKDEAKGLRDDHDADIVILFLDRSIMDHGSTAGIAFQGPLKNYPYCVVQTFGVGNGFVFSHEVGHLFGARHEPCSAHDAGQNCDDMGSHEHAHSWNYETGCLWWKEKHEKKTILFSASSDDIIQHYSNPDVFIDGKSTGIVNQRDNSTLLEANACTLANFEQGSPELSIKIEGPTYMCGLGFANLDANIEGAPGPYTYEWKLNETGHNWGSTPVESTDSYLGISAYPNYSVGDVVFIRLKVIAQNGEVKITYHSVEVVDRSSNGGSYQLVCPRNTGLGINNNEIINIYPNPASSELTIDYSIKSYKEVKIRLINAQGQVVIERNKGQLQPASYSDKFNLSILTQSHYIIELIVGNEVYRDKIIYIK